MDLCGRSNERRITAGLISATLRVACRRDGGRILRRKYGPAVTRLSGAASLSLRSFLGRAPQALDSLCAMTCFSDYQRHLTWYA